MFEEQIFDLFNSQLFILTYYFEQIDHVFVLQGHRSSESLGV